MKAFEVQNAFGIDSLALAEQPQPAPGPGQVLLKMRAWSLNYRDLLVIKGQYNPKLRLPFVPFSDGVGEVAAVGAGVTHVQPGTRVAGSFIQKWLCGPPSEEQAKSSLGGGGPGMLAEYVVLHEDGVVAVPEYLGDEEAACLPCAAVTAWHALVSEGQVKAGDIVLTQGTGGVSLFALQFARLLGRVLHHPRAATPSCAAPLDLGACDGINYKTMEDWDRRVRELTGGAGVDHVVELGGAGTLGRSLKAVRTGGRISLIGVLTGGGEINPMPILMKNVRVQGIYVGSREMFEAMNRALALHKLRPTIDRVFPFEQARAALHYMEGASHFGKIALRL